MPRRFILFDFDGVIADSLSLTYEVAHTVHPHLTLERWLQFFDGNIYDERPKEECTDECRSTDEDYFAIFSPRRDEIQIFEGAETMVRDLAENYTLCVISSSVSMDVMAFLERHDLAQYFADVLGKDVHTDKRQKIGMILDRYEAQASDCVFVTDTLGDMKEARAAGIDAIGVAWGFQSRETLQKGEPVRIVEKPTELKSAVDAYFAQRSAAVYSSR